MTTQSLGVGRIQMGRRLSGLPMLVLICVVVLYPLACLLVQVVFPNAFDVQISWVPSLAPIIEALSNPLNLQSVTDSFFVGIASSIVATVFGLTTALAARRAPRRLRSLISIFTWIVFFAPSYVIAQGWLVFMQDGGVAAQVLHLQNGWSDWYFSQAGLVLTMGFRYFPFVHFAIGQALDTSSGEYEMAARLFGAGRWRTFMRITLPLLTPAVLAGASIAFAEGFGDFGFAAAITPQTHIPLIAYQIYASLSQAPIDYASAAGLSLILLLVTGGVLGLQFWLMRGRSYVTATMNTRTSKEGGAGRFSAGTMLALSILAVAVIIPVGSVICISLWKDWGFGISRGNWTLGNYAQAFALGSGAWHSLVRSLGYSFAAATCTMVIALLVGYNLSFRKSAVNQVVNLVTMSTIAVPGVVTAAGFIFAWNAVWLIPVHLVIYGTAICLGLAYIAGTLPYAIRLQYSAMGQLSPGFVTAARLSGSGALRTLRLVVLPLVLSTVMTTFFMTLTSTMFELPASSLLYPPGAPPFPVTIEMQFNNFQWATGSALTIVGMAVVLALYLIGQTSIRWAQRRASREPEAQAAADQIKSGFGLAGLHD